MSMQNVWGVKEVALWYCASSEYPIQPHSIIANNRFFMIDESFFNLTIVMWYQNGKEVLERYVQYIRPGAHH